MHFRTVLPLLAAGGLALGGCRLPTWGGPVGGDVLDCRQYTQRGLSAIERGQWDDAEAALELAVKACPSDGEARRHYAEALWRRGARAEAIEQLQQAVRAGDDNPLLGVRLGEFLVQNGQWEAALRCAQQALDVEPTLARAWMLRAQCMQRGGQPRLALADYYRALSCDPANREALLQTAELHRELNQPERALVALQSLADTYPLDEEPPQIAFLSGLAYTALARHEDAVESYHRAARNNPTPEVLYRLAEAQLRAGRPAQARQVAAQALALDPQHAPSQTLLAQLDEPVGGRLQR